MSQQLSRRSFRSRSVLAGLAVVAVAHALAGAAQAQDAPKRPQVTTIALRCDFDITRKLTAYLTY